MIFLFAFYLKITLNFLAFDIEPVKEWYYLQYKVQLIEPLRAVDLPPNLFAPPNFEVGVLLLVNAG